MKRYSLTECYELLDVDPKTFRSWLSKAGITAEPSKADPRVKYLTEEQVKQLGYAHERSLTEGKGKQDRAIPPGTYKLLVDQVSELEHRLNVLDEQSKDVEHLTRLLRDLAEALSHRIDTVEAQVAKVVTDMEVAKNIGLGTADSHADNTPGKT